MTVDTDPVDIISADDVVAADSDLAGWLHIIWKSPVHVNFAAGMDDANAIPRLVKMKLIEKWERDEGVWLWRPTTLGECVAELVEARSAT